MKKWKVMGLIMVFAGVLAIGAGIRSYGAVKEHCSGHKLMMCMSMGKSTAADKKASEEKVTCTVMKDMKIAKSKAKVYNYKGKTYYFCCDKCVTSFKKAPEKYLKEAAPAPRQGNKSCHPAPVAPAGGGACH
ncbi:MAG: YHS domain-containing protein [bacterium]|nr:YHS domain-containing protein [bacterium]